MEPLPHPAYRRDGGPRRGQRGRLQMQWSTADRGACATSTCARRGWRAGSRSPSRSPHRRVRAHGHRRCGAGRPRRRGRLERARPRGVRRRRHRRGHGGNGGAGSVTSRERGAERATTRRAHEAPARARPRDLAVRARPDAHARVVGRMPSGSRTRRGGHGLGRGGFPRRPLGTGRDPVCLAAAPGMDAPARARQAHDGHRGPRRSLRAPRHGHAASPLLGSHRGAGRRRLPASTS